MLKWILAAAATLAFTAQASAADKVVLMLNWYVYGEHAPFYYGKAKGIYAAENIAILNKPVKPASLRALLGQWRTQQMVAAE